MEQLMAIGKEISRAITDSSLNKVCNYARELEIIECITSIKKIADEKGLMALKELLKPVEEREKITSGDDDEWNAINKVLENEAIMTYAIARLLDEESTEDLENQLALRCEETMEFAVREARDYWLVAAGIQMISEGKRKTTIEHTLLSSLPLWIEHNYCSEDWKAIIEKERKEMEEDDDFDDDFVIEEEEKPIIPVWFLKNQKISPQNSLILACMNETFTNLSDEALNKLIQNLTAEELVAVLKPLDGDTRLRVTTMLDDNRTKEMLDSWNYYSVSHFRTDYRKMEEQAEKVLAGKLPGIF